ncbi:hypothetical protein QZH41_006672 [Actinostola sp. cb2023]|nr:hypothetical protein QZH41_006672 [Actinostola sp. cb2023]
MMYQDLHHIIQQDLDHIIHGQHGLDHIIHGQHGLDHIIHQDLDHIFHQDLSHGDAGALASPGDRMVGHSLLEDDVEALEVVVVSQLMPSQLMPSQLMPSANDIQRKPQMLKKSPLGLLSCMQWEKLLHLSLDPWELKFTHTLTLIKTDGTAPTEDYVMIDKDKQKDTEATEKSDAAMDTSAEDKPEDKPEDPLEVAIAQMKAMGFHDHDGWLTHLIVAKEYDIGKVLDAIQYTDKN